VAVKIGAPMAIGGLLQFCYALVDTMFIARIDTKSTAILAGTGLMFPLFFRIFSDVKEVVALSALQVRCVSWTFVGVAAVIVSASTFQAIGKPGAALWLAVVRMGLISIPLALALVYVFDLRMWGMYIAVGTGNLTILPLALLWTRYHLKKLPSRPMSS
jgi:Na+-driven multidrug efflux pump